MRWIGKLLLPTITLVAAAHGQSNIDPAHALAWGENIGWTNWHDAGDPAGAQGVRIHDTFLSGFIWSENVGWINLGDGTPANDVSYANATGADCGVNLDPAAGTLSGLAWGENVGWINFAGGALANPPAPARLDGPTCALAGYVWGENIGWINLDDAEQYVGALPGACARVLGDLNCDGSIDFDDINPFVSALVSQLGYESLHPDCQWLSGDIDGNGSVDFDDISPFVKCLVQGTCP